MYQYYKSLMKDPAAALQVLEKYTANTYSSDLLKTLAEEYFEQNQVEKGEQVLRDYIAGTPNEIEVYDPLAAHFYGRQQYDSAVHYMLQAHQVSPYNHKVLGDIASCYMQMNNKAKALEYYKKALSLYAGGYGYRQKIRELENKPDVFRFFPALDYYGEINKALKRPGDTANAYYYIFDEKNVVQYGEGGCEQAISTAVYINNKDGIDRWKETSVPYNSVYQDVTILKAEVIKANGAKVPAETYGNQIVFTRLEEGDAIYYNYKVSSFAIGRLGREFWDKFYFTASVPTAIARYNMMIADQLPIYYEFQNNKTLKPVESKHENFRLYAWEMKNVPAYRKESFMPTIDDIGQVLHISTVKSWDIIAEWYSDLTRMQCREDFSLNAAFAEIFPNGVKDMNDWEKARRIYEYIEKNIAYSSVSFRQGAYVPQRASKTLVTRLGDCKDLSALFVAFAHKAGLDANLMLVSTRENGQHNLLLPSMEFNHCVARFKADNEYHYLELTNNRLPFNTLPQSLVAAQVLNVPFHYNSNEKISLLPADDHHKVTMLRKTKVKISNSDLDITTNCRTSGELSSIMRSKYGNKTKTELTDDLQSTLAQQSKNPVVLGDFSFSNIDNLQDTVVQELHYTVKNDVINVGDFSMIRPVFVDIVATADIFTADARQYPFEYWSYENTDQYLTDIDMELPEGRSFDQVPANVESSFNNMTYQLTFQKTAPNKLQIRRKFITNRNQDITAADFNKMKDFFNTIVNAEQKYISFK
jgi:transglutaminase-like putative cysteine protease